MIATGKLDRRITLQIASTIKESGRPKTIWLDLARVWAEVRDVPPSRAAEQMSEGASLANRPCRIRIRYRSDIMPGMRVILDGRTLHVVSMPADLGLRGREGTEFMAEELTTAGQEP